MLLNNFYQLIRYKCGITSSSTYKIVVIDESVSPITTISGVTNIGTCIVYAPSNNVGYINYPGKFISTNSFTSNIILSTDTTEPQRTDYKMDNVLTTDDLELYGASCGYNTSNMIVHSLTAKNTTSENITINKIGLMCNYWATGTANWSTLVYEELLENPVTIKPNDVYTFTIQIG